MLIAVETIGKMTQKFYGMARNKGIIKRRHSGYLSIWTCQLPRGVFSVSRVLEEKTEAVQAERKGRRPARHEVKEGTFRYANSRLAQRQMS